MENASKALIIAGAILLAILIIGLGIFIYGQAAGTANDAGMDALSANAYNAQFESYIRSNVSGTNALKLFDAVVANKGSTGKDVDMYYKTSTASGNGTKLTITNSTGLDQTLINAARRTLQEKSSKYNITAERDTKGYINKITFNY